MKYCSHCGAEVADDAVICTKCGCQVGQLIPAPATSAPAPTEGESKAPLTLGILAIIFGALGGWLGLVLGIIGLCIDKKKRYTGLNATGIVLFLVWGIIYIILLATSH